jgi:hypothetical protein
LLTILTTRGWVVLLGMIITQSWAGFNADHDTTTEASGEIKNDKTQGPTPQFPTTISN